MACQRYRLSLPVILWVKTWRPNCLDRTLRSLLKILPIWKTAMLDRIYLLLFLSVPPIFSHWLGNDETKCPVFSGKSIFVSTAGQDSETCGVQTKPCRSITYAVNLAVHQNVSSVVLNISAGNYQEAENIKLDCGRRSLQSVTFWGARYGYKITPFLPYLAIDFDNKLCLHEITDAYMQGISLLQMAL